MELLLLADPEEGLVQKYVAEGQCYVYEELGQVIGEYVLLPKNETVVELINVAVSECVQGRGLGKMLVQHAVQSARNLGYSSIEVGTGNSSVGQLHLYQKCGFRITGIDTDFFVRNYAEPIMENGMQCRDMIRMSQLLYRLENY
ncbi:GNAT family N-acetyltransferase [Paenibacillus sp. N1-5-1-14]|uniref:GNAT family N-acetyltransferase n=1 Tax=Paenibacillus radicibacter TaxID=2972488 RepID=UPI002159221A|nr:GNAT family N-acetyltransferase [Paenibacillus radicibacter]MCR8641285.1 GNAT family N-acetyltransferase [Paenibacillus radicibacter]